jgi:predicted metal-binding membrane protein
MMLPSVAPTLLLYAAVARTSRAHPKPLAPVAWFAAGYVLAWCSFSVCATLAQWGLESLAQLTPMMSLASRQWGGAMLIGVGLYQWLPLKQACLSNCRSPLSFIQRAGGFQAGFRGSIRLGLLHGLYCIGCCWALMLLLFVGGVMNLAWIAALMILVLLEKLVRAGPHLAKLLGVAALLGGAGFLL